MPRSAGIDGVLSVLCDLPDTIGVDFEGITIEMPSLNLDFTRAADADPNAHGVTPFHRLR